MQKGKAEKILSSEKNNNRNHIENYSKILDYFKADLKEEKFLKEITSNSNRIKIKKFLNWKNPVDIVKGVYERNSLTERLRNLDSEIDVVKLREANENNFSTINSWRSVTNIISKSKENRNRNTNSKNLYKKEELIFHHNDNLDFLKNFLSNLKNHKEIFDKMEKLLKCDTSDINSENKQIKFYLLILDAFLSLNFKEKTDISPNENICENLEKKFNSTKLSLIDSLFRDFCTHLSISSNFRSEFLQRIWKAKSFYTEKNVLKTIKETQELKNKFEILEENLNHYKNKLITSEEKSSKLNETIIKLQKEIKNLDKEIDQRNNKITQISSKLHEITRQNDIKDELLKDMIEKVNFRKNRFESSNKKIEKGVSDNYSNTKFTYDNRNEREYATVDYSEKNNLDDEISYSEEKFSSFNRKSIFNQVSKFNIGSFSASNIFDFNNKDLIKNRNDNIYRKSLKLKILQKNSNSNIFDFRKQMIVDQSVIKINTPKIPQDTINTAKRQSDLQMYLNKGIEIVESKFLTKGIQTDIINNEREIDFDKNLIDKNNVFRLNTTRVQEDFTNISEILEKLKKYVSHKIHDRNEIEYYIQNSLDIIGKTSKFIEMELTESYAKCLKDLNILSEDSKNTKMFLDKLAGEQNETEKLQREIFEAMQNSISECTNNLINITNQIETDKKDICYKEILFSLNKIIGQNEKALRNPKLNSELHSSEYIRSNKEKNQLSKSGLDLLKDFKSNEDKLPHSFKMKKCIEIIDFIYFNLISEIYFKNNFIELESQTNLIAQIDFSIKFIELPLIYIRNRYLIDSLSIKKFLEFLKSITVNRSHKRINLFNELVIKSGNDEYNLLTNENSYDALVLKYFILLVHFIKVEHCLYNEEENLSDKNYNKLFLVFNKFSDVISALVDKFEFFSVIKQKILIFLGKNKIIIRKKLILIDFDDFMEYYVEILKEYANKFRNYLHIVSKSVDLEEKNYFNFLDFIIAYDALYTCEKTFDNIRLIFNSNSNETGMKYETFENLIVESHKENFRFNKEMFKEFCENDQNKIEKIILSLKEDLEGTSVSMFDIIFKRLSVMKSSHIEKIIHKKVEILKDSIVNYDKSNIWVIWTSLKILEKLSEIIYNETKLSLYFENLSGIYQILSNKNEKSPIIEYLEKN